MKSALALSALVAGLLVSATALAADPPVAAASTAARASATVKGATLTSTGAKGAEAGKINAQTSGTITNNAGNSQYPTGTPVVPPKPKKEGLEQTPAIKANVKAAQP